MESRNVMFAVGFVTIVILVLVSFLLFFFLNYRNRSNRYVKERELLKKTYETTLLRSQVEVQEATLSFLARELHDNVCQLLSSSKMLLAIAQMTNNDVPDVIISADATIGQAINELRMLSRSLDKEWLERFDLIVNLDNEIDRVNSGRMVYATFSHSGKLTLEPEQQIILFRIIQEALQNAIKHARAKKIGVNILLVSDKISVSITDDGIGIDAQMKDGFGIQSMKHRAKLLGGEIIWKNTSPGSKVLITLPIKSEL